MFANLRRDLDAIMERDPAASNRLAAIFLYPSFQVMLAYRLSHVLWHLRLRFIARLMPEKRVYTAERQTTTEAAIRPRPAGDDYAVLGDGDDRVGYSLRLYYKPLISWIWGGTALMAFGGLVAMTGRRRQSAPNNSDVKTIPDIKSIARGRI